MTTQVQTVFLWGMNKGRKFSKTQTDGTEAEITSTTGTLSLDDALPGETIEYYMAEFAAGIGIAHIVDQNDQIKATLINEVIGEMRPRKLRQPVTIQEGDKLKGLVNVA